MARQSLLKIKLLNIISLLDKTENQWHHTVGTSLSKKEQIILLENIITNGKIKLCANAGRGLSSKSLNKPNDRDL